MIKTNNTYNHKYELKMFKVFVKIDEIKRSYLGGIIKTTKPVGYYRLQEACSICHQERANDIHKVIVMPCDSIKPKLTENYL